MRNGQCLPDFKSIVGELRSLSYEGQIGREVHRRSSRQLRASSKRERNAPFRNIHTSEIRSMDDKDTNNQTVDLDPAVALEKLDSWVDGFMALLPNIAVALVVFAIFYALSLLAKRLISGTASRRGRADLGEVLGKFGKWVLLVVGALLAATIVMPTLNPGDLIAGLGISSVAIGFAFKDILQNWLAGLLLLLRQPFEVGDQIEVSGYEGTVQHIESRSTIIKTYDSRRVIIPNSIIYTSEIVVKTAYDERRSQYDVGIGYGDDPKKAREVILEALRGIDGIESDPAPQVLLWDLAASWLTIRARWWTDTRRADIVSVRSQVIGAIKSALDEARIDMPYETQVLLLHGQTDELDGDRSKQREGWPAPKEGSPRPRWKVAGAQD